VGEAFFYGKVESPVVERIETRGKAAELVEEGVFNKERGFEEGVFKLNLFFQTTAAAPEVDPAADANGSDDSRRLFPDERKKAGEITGGKAHVSVEVEKIRIGGAAGTKVAGSGLRGTAFDKANEGIAVEKRGELVGFFW